MQKEGSKLEVKVLKVDDQMHDPESTGSVFPVEKLEGQGEIKIHSGHNNARESEEALCTDKL